MTTNNENKLNIKNIFTNFPDVVKVKDLQKMLGIGRNLAYGLKNKKFLTDR